MVRAGTVPTHATGTGPVRERKERVVTVHAPGRHDGSELVRACRGQAHERIPAWFMRQAGRALPEYRALRAEHDFEQLVRTPELAAEVTLQPVRRYGVDAAILFSDIVTPLQAMGLGVEIRPGVGPVVEHPVRTASDLERLRPLEVESDLGFVLDTVSILVGELDVPLIGFGGGPFTLASYLVEGGPSKSYTRTKAMMFGDEPRWHDLMERLAGITLESLRGQVVRGAAAVQLFDSWAGALHPADYERYVAPHSRVIFEGLADLGVPRIHFGVTTGELLGAMAAVGADVVGVDWRVPLAEARRRVGEGVGLQGNLDPAVALGPWPLVERRVREILDIARSRTDHVFNLGHGVLPETDPGVLERIVELVHREGRLEVEAGAGSSRGDALRG